MCTTHVYVKRSSGKLLFRSNQVGEGELPSTVLTHRQTSHCSNIYTNEKEDEEKENRTRYKKTDGWIYECQRIGFQIYVILSVLYSSDDKIKRFSPVFLFIIDRHIYVCLCSLLFVFYILDSLVI